MATLPYTPRTDLPTEHEVYYFHDLTETLTFHDATNYFIPFPRIFTIFFVYIIRPLYRIGISELAGFRL